MPVNGDISLNKLIILFVFDKMEVPLSESTITEICCSANNWMSYMDCKPTISKLIEVSFIYQVTSSTDPLYAITHDGRACLADFFVGIPTSIRESITQFAKNNRTKFRKKQEYLSDYFMNKDGTYTVYLKIMETAGAQLELKFVVPSRQIAKSIYDKWPDKAESTYASIYENLVD